MKIVIISIIAVFIFVVVVKISNDNNASDSAADKPKIFDDVPTPTDKNTASKSNEENVRVVDGKQIIELVVSSGYSPQKSVAKSGIPTIVRFVTDNTFDCSSAIRIQSLGISKNLPSTGSTDIDIGIQNNGTLNGSCGMGMYPFEIEFD